MPVPLQFQEIRQSLRFNRNKKKIENRTRNKNLSCSDAHQCHFFSNSIVKAWVMWNAAGGQPVGSRLDQPRERRFPSPIQPDIQGTRICISLILTASLDDNIATREGTAELIQVNWVRCCLFQVPVCQALHKVAVPATAAPNDPRNYSIIAPPPSQGEMESLCYLCILTLSLPL